MVKQRKRILVGVIALGSMMTSTLTTMISPVQAKPSTGALVIGGLAAYGVYSASKHHRNDDNRGGYGYSGRYGYGRRYQGEHHGDYDPERHSGYGNNGGYYERGFGSSYGYSGSYNGQSRSSERYDQHHRDYGGDSYHKGGSYSNRDKHSRRYGHH